MIETQLQGHLVAATIEAGGFAVKVSHRFIIGVADLWVQFPGLIGVWIEVKLIKDIPARGVARVDLTPHQRKYIRGVEAAGGRAGWLLGVETKPGRLLFACGRGVIGHTGLNDVIIRERGAPWPIRQIVERMQ